MPSAVLHIEPGPNVTSMSPPSETDLSRVWARRIRASDSSALESLFRTVHADLVGFAESFLHDRASARDVTQDAFVRIWEMRAEIDPERSLTALAYTTVRNLCLNRLRDSRKRSSILADRYEAPVISGPQPDQAAAGAELEQHLRTWVADLPERQRESLVLTRFQGLSHEEAAEAMGVSPRTVNNHLVKALRTIRERVREYEPSLLD